MDGVEKLVEGQMSVCRELIEAKEEIFRMQGMIQAIVKTINQKEVPEAKSKYSKTNTIRKI